MILRFVISWHLSGTLLLSYSTFFLGELLKLLFMLLTANFKTETSRHPTSLQRIFSQEKNVFIFRGLNYCLLSNVEYSTFHLMLNKTCQNLFRKLSFLRFKQFINYLVVLFQKLVVTLLKHGEKLWRIRVFQ